MYFFDCSRVPDLEKEKAPLRGICCFLIFKVYAGSLLFWATSLRFIFSQHSTFVEEFIGGAGLK